MRRISILGCTGSIGKQALQVIRLHPDRFQVAALTAHSDTEGLFDLVREFRPAFAALTAGEQPIPEDVKAISEFHFGHGALAEAAALPETDDVLDAVSGMAGLEAVLQAGKAGKRVLLANKEALVAGGKLVMALFGLLDEHRLLPVDSEHSAIWQCLENNSRKGLSEILLTASGGPFRTWPKERMEHATVEEALGHPNWSMGKKITIDSATMFNKALEIIEARWLFNVDQRKIRVLIHPQSVVHSGVRFRDGTVLCQLGIPDMRLPILYAMSYPERLETGTEDLDLLKVGSLTFEAPDLSRFPALDLARQVLDAGGCAACVLNAANEEAAHAFLAGHIPFGGIYRVVDGALNALPNREGKTLEDVLEMDTRARECAKALIRKESV
ncbi:MAG: 1-deoxy-D-xylulose-5-phosphate reductoisomerase [Clostridia bacterium]|nr:1-deoxy-D-xylulose-5-phosphate reductoisomerase [Clostridia bacterium]